MDFRLKVFEICAQTLNYTEAAKELDISQPAVTKHIQALEQQYKVKLFTRSGRSLILTYAGKMLLEKAVKILELYSQMESEGKLLSNVTESTFHIGMPAAIYYGIYSEFAADYCRLSPNATLHSSIITSNKLADSLLKREIDIAVSVSVADKQSPREDNPASDIVESLFFTDTLMAVGSRGLNEDGYYDMADIKLLLYDGDIETSTAISSILSGSNLTAKELNISAKMTDPIAAIKFLVEYGKGGSLSAMPMVSFFWKSQITKLLQRKIVCPVQVTELQDYPIIRREYRIAQIRGKEIPGLRVYARNWAKTNLWDV